MITNQNPSTKILSRINAQIAVFQAYLRVYKISVHATCASKAIKF
ncbi:hypothetical protein CAMGR0001_1398 [Campylobacter gracilis RM3268]|uniref:Uncharacterized protein n=1 Tax=Campylobacter gracilis RM3268 TaxID=553220 RepID=C8PJJ7_9BACT|nr:hypothetical protein CAMGR0001_1398 [Campylobacter gracilis RM3268]